MDIDLVLPYVDMNKERWQALYQETNKKLNRVKKEDSRYRQLLDLKYLLRCIDKYCPFIRTLYLVVQTRDQVPDYVKESSKLKIIEHKEIIPKDLLPTYNSATIECFICKIKGLSEHFIYINDDMYPLCKLSESDFFTEDGKPRINVYLKTEEISTYRMMLKNSEKFVKKILNIKDIDSKNQFYRDGHSWTPMIKSHWLLLHKLNTFIKRSCTTFRDRKNVVQQVVTYYEYFTHNFAPKEIRTKYWDFKKTTDLKEFLIGKYHIVCINDTGLIENVDDVMKNLKDWFEVIVPDKSEKYEN